MSYADAYRRQSELKKMLGPKNLTEIISEEIARRRAEACAVHLHRWVRRMRYTAGPFRAC